MVSPETYDDHDRVVALAEKLDVEIDLDAVYERADETDRTPLHVMAAVGIELATRRASNAANQETPDGPGTDFL